MPENSKLILTEIKTSNAFMSIFNILLWFTMVIAIVEAIKPLRNGQDSSSDIIKKFPYLVGLAAADGNENINQTVCSGTLVSPDYVLTSAHCTSLLKNEKIMVFSRKSTIATKIRLAIRVYTHPLYNPALRMFDLSMVKLKRPFRHINRFVKLSSRKFDQDVNMNCTVVGIKALDGRSYKVPVRAKYGRSACQIPKSNPILTYILGYTWTDFMCIQTFGPSSPHLPCGRSEPLLCGRHTQYGIFSYGYGTDDTANSGSSSVSNNGPEPIECGDPTVQGRSLFVNKHYKWISDTMSGNPVKTIMPKVGTVGISVNTADTLDSRRSNLTLAITPSSTTPSSTTLSTPTRLAPTNRERNFSSGSDDYSYLVHLQGLADEPTCGGSLISPFHVLTSAYCTTRMTKIHVTATYHSQLHTDAVVIYVHPDYDVETLTADVSIVVLRDPFNVSKYIEMVDTFDPPNVNKTVVMLCMIVATKPTAPYYFNADVRVKYGPKACWKAAVSEIQTSIDQNWREFICGLFDGQREEDTGNPLICNGMQYGVISHSYQIAHPNVNISDQMRFLAVKNYKGWITDVVNEMKHQEAAYSGAKNYQCGLTIAIIILLLSNVFQ